MVKNVFLILIQINANRLKKFVQKPSIKENAVLYSNLEFLIQLDIDANIIQPHVLKEICIAQTIKEQQKDAL